MKNHFTLTGSSLCLESMAKIVMQIYYAQQFYFSSQADTVRKRCQCNGFFIKISVSAFAFRYKQRQWKKHDWRNPKPEMDLGRISEKHILIKHTGGSRMERIMGFLMAILFAYFVDFFQCFHQHGEISLEKHTIGTQQPPKRIFISKETSGEKQTSGTTEEKSLCWQ